MFKRIWQTAHMKLRVHNSDTGNNKCKWTKRCTVMLHVHVTSPGRDSPLADTATGTREVRHSHILRQGIGNHSQRVFWNLFHEPRSTPELFCSSANHPTTGGEWIWTTVVNILFLMYYSRTGAIKQYRFSCPTVGQEQ